MWKIIIRLNPSFTALISKKAKNWAPRERAIWMSQAARLERCQALPFKQGYLRYSSKSCIVTAGKRTVLASGSQYNTLHPFPIHFWYNM
ncbi:hypothetical protein XELAEV_18038995mg [Xenopus laevis]|uniref:Uncharacterized protein n=1 Tax=Xenopus laevis TaxID=8355 RepID=A0A974C6N7_XENLA|nr:hypothetical protein XELAEV_18038995mg [Xenopus laevis]